MTEAPRVDDALIGAVEAKIAAEGLAEEQVFGLRKTWPDLHFTYCMDDDIGALEPYRQAQGYNIYLVTGRDHCISFTNEIAAATGLVIACIEGDDET